MTVSEATVPELHNQEHPGEYRGNDEEAGL